MGLNIDNPLVSSLYETACVEIEKWKKKHGLGSEVSVKLLVHVDTFNSDTEATRVLLQFWKNNVVNDSEDNLELVFAIRENELYTYNKSYDLNDPKVNSEVLVERSVISVLNMSIKEWNKRARKIRKREKSEREEKYRFMSGLN